MLLSPEDVVTMIEKVSDWIDEHFGSFFAVSMALVMIVICGALFIAAIDGNGSDKANVEPDELPRAALEWTRVEPVGDMTDISHECYRVMDKETGQRWWVIDRGSWGAIVLEVGDADE